MKLLLSAFWRKCFFIKSKFFKIDDEIKSKKFGFLKDFFFYFYWAHLGSFGPAHGLGWAGLGFLNSSPAQPKPENRGPCRPLACIKESHNPPTPTPVMAENPRNHRNTFRNRHTCMARGLGGVGER